MSPEDKSFVTRLFAVCIAFVFCFMIIAVVASFIYARLKGLPVDIDRFYGVIGPAFTMILTTVLGLFALSRGEK
jgi:chromate transport protein ChrA